MNRLLLDTHAFLWWDSAPGRLSATVLALCRDPSVVLYLSLVSLREIQIKSGLGKLPLSLPLAEIVRDQQARHGLQILPTPNTADHARARLRAGCAAPSPQGPLRPFADRSIADRGPEPRQRGQHFLFLPRLRDLVTEAALGTPRRNIRWGVLLFTPPPIPPAGTHSRRPSRGGRRSGPRSRRGPRPCWSSAAGPRLPSARRAAWRRTWPPPST